MMADLKGLAIFIANILAYGMIALIIISATTDFLNTQCPKPQKRGAHGVLFVVLCILAVWWID